MLKNPQTTTFYLVRHAHSLANELQLVAGRWDVPLTLKGEEQSRKRGEHLRDVHFDLAFSSDLIRAKRTAEIILQERKLLLKTTKLLRERNYGILEGEKTQEEAQKVWKQLIAFWQKEHDTKPDERLVPGMETNNEIITRMTTFLRETAITHPGKNIFVATHGDMLVTLLHHIGFLRGKKVGLFANVGYIVVETDGSVFEVKEIEGLELKKA